MKTAEQWLNEYGETHQNPVNKEIHLICVPLILWSLLAILWSMPVPMAVLSIAPWFNWALPTVVLLLPFYARLGLPYFLQMTMVAAVVLASCWWLERLGAPLMWIAIAVFIAAWVGQFYGHKVEGKKPSFLSDLQFLLIGPLWTLRGWTRK